jgi:L-fuconolactonase
MAGVPLESIVFVEANPRPDLALAEVEFVGELAAAEPRIEGIVAFADLLGDRGVEAAFDALVERPLVRGVRHNIQGNPPGFALQPRFVTGVREAGRRGFTFDLCATHAQLHEVDLAREAEGSPLVLDHCGKPGIRDGLWEPWASNIRQLAALPNVWCKISGLLTEADRAWRPRDIVRYAEHVVSCFGTDRIIYGSDWPVLTLTDRSTEWYAVTRLLTAGWSADERQRFYRDNARRFYGLQTSDNR